MNNIVSFQKPSILFQFPSPATREKKKNSSKNDNAALHHRKSNYNYLQNKQQF